PALTVAADGRVVRDRAVEKGEDAGAINAAAPAIIACATEGLVVSDGGVVDGSGSPRQVGDAAAQGIAARTTDSLIVQYCAVADGDGVGTPGLEPATDPFSRERSGVARAADGAIVCKRQVAGGHGSKRQYWPHHDRTAPAGADAEVVALI